MKRVRKAVAFLLFVLLIWTSNASLANEEKVAEGERQEAEETSSYVSVSNDQLCQQIRDTYKAARKRAHRKSFKGYCGAYVANQLVVLGINTSYLSASGKTTYDIYRGLDQTTGGYDVFTYSARSYSLSEALHAIVGDDPAAENILVGFQRGVSSSGRKYGHVLFIHGIRNGQVYFSDSSARTVDDVTYQEGEPIVCSLSSFVNLYAEYRLDGVVHFERSDAHASMTEETTAGSSEKSMAVG